jgi:hypothetical protein
MSAGKYAKGTEVPEYRTRNEIEAMLLARGARAIGIMQEDELSAVMFKMEGRGVKFVLTMPTLDDPDIGRTPTGRLRTKAAAQQALNDERKRMWRALLLVLKAKFEAVDSGIVSFDQEFLGNTMLPGTSYTVYDEVAEPMRARLEGSDTPLLQIGGSR